jgi:hypothetical protein
MNSAVKVSQKIKSGEWKEQIVDILQFFTVTITGEYVPKPDSRVQVRQLLRDVDRVQRIYNKVKEKKDYSKLEPITLIKYPNGALKIGNGNHTVEVEAMLGMKQAPAYVVDFDKDLDGKHSSALRLGNLLNQHDVDRASVSDADIKKEFYQLIEENNGKLSDTQKKEFAKTYPEVSPHTIGQWQAHHDEVGGRKKPLVTYTTGALIDQVKTLQSLQRYSDYAICHPRTLRAWSDTGISAAFSAMQEENKKKAIVILYCDTITMAENWEKGKIKNTIAEKYAKLGEHFGVTIEFEMMAYE